MDEEQAKFEQLCSKLTKLNSQANSHTIPSFSEIEATVSECL